MASWADKVEAEEAQTQQADAETMVVQAQPKQPRLTAKSLAQFNAKLDQQAEELEQQELAVQQLELQAKQRQLQAKREALLVRQQQAQAFIPLAGSIPQFGYGASPAGGMPYPDYGMFPGSGMGMPAMAAKAAPRQGGPVRRAVKRTVDDDARSDASGCTTATQKARGDFRCRYGKYCTKPTCKQGHYCAYGAECTRVDTCIFLHDDQKMEPVAPEGAVPWKGYIGSRCMFGMRCNPRNGKTCTRGHYCIYGKECKFLAPMDAKKCNYAH